MAPLSFLLIALWIISVGCLFNVVRMDDYFDQLFISNSDECQHYPINFDNDLPDWLHGTMIRNGLGVFKIGDRQVTYAMDAYGKMTKVTFDNKTRQEQGNRNGALHQTMMAYSTSYVTSLQSKTITPYLLFGSSDPPFSPEQMNLSLVRGVDNMNINVVRYGNDTQSGYVILSDAWNSYEINPRNLAPVRTINPPLDGVPSSYKIVRLGTPHPLPEYATTNHITFVALASAIPEFNSIYQVYRVTSAEDRQIIATIRSDKISYMHSFAVTKNYAVIFACPLYIDPNTTVNSLKPLENGLQWNPGDKTKIYTVHLKTALVDTFETDAMFFLHHVNAFEDVFGNPVIDIATYDDGNEVLSAFKMERLYNASNRSTFVKPHLRRYTIDMNTRLVDVRPLNTGPTSVPYAARMEFPIINENFRFENYCYIYGIVYNVNGTDFLDMVLIKKDICTGTKDKAWYQKGVMFNEPIFVADPKGVNEDDGLLLVDVLDTTNRSSYMLIFDARNLTNIISSKLPIPNPFGTHGKFFDGVV